MFLVLLLWFCFFFFKQKTAYEMRISDWSSDVCSSDLSFNRPAIVIGIDEFGVGKGSGRSIAGVDLGRAIMDAVLDKKLVGGGGHVMACGLTIDPEKVQVFREYLNSKIGEQSSKARQENATLFDATLFTSDKIGRAHV